MAESMHAHIEVKIDGKWHHFAAPDIKPDYQLFAIVAGEGIEYLRNGDEIEPVAKEKAMPSDASLVTAMCYAQDKPKGARNVSVLAASDLEELQEKLYRYNPYAVRSEMGELNLEHGILRTYINGGAIAKHLGWDDARVICWFYG